MATIMMNEITKMTVVGSIDGFLRLRRSGVAAAPTTRVTSAAASCVAPGWGCIARLVTSRPPAVTETPTPSRVVQAARGDVSRVPLEARCPDLDRAADHGCGCGAAAAAVASVRARTGTNMSDSFGLAVPGRLLDRRSRASSDRMYLPPVPVGSVATSLRLERASVMVDEPNSVAEQPAVYIGDELQVGGKELSSFAPGEDEVGLLRKRPTSIGQTGRGD